MIDLRKFIQRCLLRIKVVEVSVSFRIMLLMLMFFSVGASANIFSQILSTRTVHHDYYMEYNYTYSISAWTSEHDSEPNPCYGDSQCKLWVDHRHSEAGESGQADKDYPPIYIGKAKTIGDVRKLWIKAYPMPNTGETQHTGDVLTNECVGLFYGHYIEDPFNGEGFDVPLFPTSICGLAPPPTGHCQFNTHNVTLNYGSVSPEALNGKQISATVTVSCDADMNLEAWLINPQDGSDSVPLRTDGSLSAKLTLDGETATTKGKAFSVTSGGSQALTITSEAVVSGTPEPGEFSGSALLFLSIP